MTEPHQERSGFVTPEGEVIPNLRLTRPSAPARKICLLFRYNLSSVPWLNLKNVDLLFP